MQEFIKLARAFFLSYCHIINPQFKSNWHHIEIARHLDAIADGKPRRIIVSLPPQHGKSFMISQHFPTYYLGRNPRKNVISTAYNQSLVEDFGTYVKNIMLSDSYRAIFPINIDTTSKSKKRFGLHQGGTYYAVGKGGPITGRGAHLIIIDDLIKNESEARSATHRKQVYDWYKNTLRTRLRHGGSIIVVQTRWHELDLIGELLEKSGEKWEYLKYPAISESGEPLWSELFPIETLLATKQDIGTMAFQGLYQQEPCLDDGNFIKADWIKRYNLKTGKPVAFDDMVMTFDLTFKGETTSDFVVGQIWGSVGPDCYLLDMIRGQWDFTKTLFHMKHFMNKHNKCRNILIEDAANGAAVFSTIKNSVPGVRLWKPQTSKEGRLLAVSPMYESGNIYIPDSEEFEVFISEHLSFPNAQHDDIVDAATMALINLKNRGKRVLISMGDSIY